MRRLRILTWHVHGSYLYYLTHAPHEFYLPVAKDGTGGRTGGYPWGDNVHEVPAERVRDAQFDLVLFQSHTNYLVDQFELLSAAQRRLPRIFLEHDPPRGHPTDTRHPVDDPEVLLVHVTHFNDLMWDSGRTPTRVIDHGVVVPEGLRCTYERAAGVVVINELRKRGRRLGHDIFERARLEAPLTLYGIAAEELGGEASLPHAELLRRVAGYRVFFNPIRYTSLGLAVIEAMMIGLPVIGLATTEMVTLVENGVSGWLYTDPDRAIAALRDLIRDPAEARRLGEGARRRARECHSIGRFTREWNAALAEAVGSARGKAVAAGGPGRGP